jgi:hypothetical protein
MDVKRNRKKYLLLALAAACAAPVFAVDAEAHGESYYSERAGENPRFIQRLNWKKDEYAYRYEVMVERRNPSGYTEALREFTREAFIEVSLPPGDYRYRIRVYDLLDRRGETSGWINFQILPALQPELRSFTPQSFDLNAEEAWRTITLEGLNFVEGCRVYLRPLQADGPYIIPRRFIPAPSGQSARLVFETAQLRPGDYEVYIKNPGGLETVRGTFSVTFSRASAGLFDLSVSVSAAWTPLFPLYGALNDFLDANVFLPGASARIGIIPVPLQWPAGSLGVELNSFWNYFSAHPGGSDMSAQFGSAHANLLFQKPLAGDTLTLNLRLGAGLSSLRNFYLEGGRYTMASPISTTRPSAGAGISLTWLVTETFFAEAGAGYLHCFFADAPSGYAQAVLGGGVKLGNQAAAQPP